MRRQWVRSFYFAFKECKCCYLCASNILNLWSQFLSLVSRGNNSKVQKVSWYISEYNNNNGNGPWQNLIWIRLDYGNSSCSNIIIIGYRNFQINLISWFYTKFFIFSSLHLKDGGFWWWHILPTAATKCAFYGVRYFLR